MLIASVSSVVYSPESGFVATSEGVFAEQEVIAPETVRDKSKVNTSESNHGDLNQS